MEKCHTVFFVYRSINTCPVGEMQLCSTLCINVFLLDNIMDSVILESVGGVYRHSLTHILNVDVTNDGEELNIIKHSPYLDQKNFKKTLKGKITILQYYALILSLNSQ